MKLIFTLIFTLSTFNLLAQEKTVIGGNAPINVSEEGVGRMEGESLEEAKARRELELSRVKESKTIVPDSSPDGSLDEKKAEEVVAAPKEAQPVEKIVKKEPSFKTRELSHYVFATVGHQFSKWSKRDSKLKDGTTLYGFGMIRPISEDMELIGSVTFAYGKGDDFAPENIRMISLKFGANYLKQYAEKMSLILGASLSVSDYNIRKVRSRNSEVISYDRFGDGGALGANLDIGNRFYFSKSFSTDLVASYNFYFQKDLKHGGGPSVALRLNFTL